MILRDDTKIILPVTEDITTGNCIEEAPEDPPTSHYDTEIVLPARKGFNQYRDIVLEYIRANPGVRSAAISRALSVPPKDIYNLLDKLNREKKIAKTSYSVPGRASWEAVYK
jgi:hypothetical protein